MSENPKKIRFSLKKIPKPRRREAMTEVAGRTWMNVDFNPLTNDPELEIESRILPGVVISDMQVSAHRSASSYDPSRDSDDFGLLWAHAPSKASVTHLGREQVADGSAVLLSCADRMIFETHEKALPHTGLKLQRSLLSPLLPDVEAALMRPVPANNEALRLLTFYLAGLRSFGDTDFSPELAHVAATHIADLVALTVGTRSEEAQLASGRGLRAARLHAVKRWVLDRLGSPGLNIGAAAAAVGLSQRSVQLLFEAEGTTFTRYVLSNRLKLAHRRLSAPQLAHRTISEIAYDCGFQDLSYFDRSFRAAYGETPSDVRHRLGSRVKKQR
jgi:AraC-like DNA-binding protein